MSAPNFLERLPIMTMFRYCDMNDYPCVVYDHECSGLSSGDVKNVTFTSWVEDALAVVDRLTEVNTNLGFRWLVIGNPDEV